MYYNFDKLFSYNFLLAFVISERGVGKTFGSKVAMLNKWLKNGEEFVYVRRYKTELDSALNNFWSDLQENGYFEDYCLEVKKNKMITKFLCDGKVCGYAIPLSTSNILKSTAFPKVKTIVFDEYMLDSSGTYRYLKNEVTMMLDFIETIGRLRDIQVIFLGNNTSFYGCPYTAYFDLELPYGSEFKTFKNGTILVNYVKNEVYREAKRNSRFGKLIDGTASEIMVVSETRMMSAARRSLFSVAHAASDGLPISSSPSRMNFTLCLSSPLRTRNSNALICINS